MQFTHLRKIADGRRFDVLQGIGPSGLAGHGHPVIGGLSDVGSAAIGTKWTQAAGRPAGTGASIVSAQKMRNLPVKGCTASF